MLHKMRQKSDGEKNKLAIIFAASITLIIVLIWFLAIKNQKGDEVAKTNSMAENLKPLSLIFKNAKVEFKGLKENAKNYKATPIDANAISPVIK